MVHKLVSIIIPVYNNEKFLHRCISSVLNQTYLQKEIILVDDGSTDTSGKICDLFSSQYSFVKTIHQKNKGAAVARQTGVLYAKGEYITFVDSDDFLKSDYIENMMAPTFTDDVDVVVGTMKNYDGLNYIEYKPFFKFGFYDRANLQKEVFPQMLSATPYYFFGVSPSMCGKLWKRSIVEKNLDSLNCGISFGEDGCFTYSALLDCNFVYFTSCSGYIYCLNSQSVTQTFKERLFEETCLLRNFYEALSKRKNWAIGTQLDEYIAYICNYVVELAITSKKHNCKNLKHSLKDYIDKNFPKKILKNKKLKMLSKSIKIRYFLIKNFNYVLVKFFLERGG